MQISNKKAQMIVSAYGLIVVLANICGVMIPNLFWVSTGNDKYCIRYEVLK